MATQTEKKSLQNTSYVFVPFTYKDWSKFGDLVTALNQNPSWELKHDEITYMLKYVADKINSYDSKNCQCFHYLMTDSLREQVGLKSADTWFTTSEHKYYGEPTKFRFKILEVHLYCFSTSVGILAFKVFFEDEDPFRISAAQYYLKKVSRELISIEGEDESYVLLDLAQKLAESFEQNMDIDFFYYANPSTERANLLTYMEVPQQENYKKELFYLRRCYNDGFSYAENETQDAEEIYAPANDMVWGITAEAAVCLVCLEQGRREFIETRFYKNFNNQYLFMYVLLLHQKYVLYNFLMKIGIGTYNRLEELEEYRNQLYEFETDFVFSCVTEVPQYQILYEKLMDAFSLKQMYADVHEPIISLSEVRRSRAEDMQKKRDDKMNKALFMLSILSIFSALTDGYDVVEKYFTLPDWFPYGELFREAFAEVMHIAIFIYIAIIFVRIWKLIKK